MIALSTALQGLSSAQNGVNRAAARIAQQSLNPSQDTLVNDVVDLMQWRNDFEANLKTVKTGDEMTKATLDILA